MYAPFSLTKVPGLAIITRTDLSRIKSIYNLFDAKRVAGVKENSQGLPRTFRSFLPKSHFYNPR